MVSRTLFRATKSSAHTPLDNFCSVIEPLSSILQIQIPPKKYEWALGLPGLRNLVVSITKMIPLTGNFQIDFFIMQIGKIANVFPN